MSFFSGTGAVTLPLKMPVCPTDVCFTSSVFQSQGPIVDRNCLVLVFLPDTISTVHPSANRVRILCMSPAKNGGKIIPTRTLHPRFGETVGRVSGVDWLFALDEIDPWVKTYVIFHGLHTVVP